MTDSKIPLVIIAGPTGTGKTEIAISVAQKINAEIIISDSRQIYKYFNIGTAKPTQHEKNSVPHHLIDICEPDYTYTVAEYQAAATDAINKIINKNKIPMMVGGTGLYIKAVVEGFKIPSIPPNEEIRKELKKLANQNGSLHLYEKLNKIDPLAASKIHQNDLFRIIRALEVFYVSGEPISNLWQKADDSPYELFYIGINTSKEILKERIKSRINNMIEEGLIDEVQSIIDKYSDSLPLLYTLNYREIIDLIKNKISLQEAKDLMFSNTKKYSKQQLTWFKADKRIVWYNIIDYNNIQDIIDNIYEVLVNNDLFGKRDKLQWQKE